MRVIGIRELRQQASRYLREVELGETIEITDRGRPVARLMPIPHDDGLEQLIASGRLAPSRGDALELRPLTATSGAALPSETLAEIRSDER